MAKHCFRFPDKYFLIFDIFECVCIHYTWRVCLFFLPISFLGFLEKMTGTKIIFFMIVNGYVINSSGCVCVNLLRNWNWFEGFWKLLLLLLPRINTGFSVRAECQQDFPNVWTAYFSMHFREHLPLGISVIIYAMTGCLGDSIELCCVEIMQPQGLDLHFTPGSLIEW